MFILTLVAYIKSESYRSIYLMLFIISIPAFSGGLLEDLIGKLKPKWRMLLIIISSLLAFTLIDAKIIRLDLPTDIIFHFAFISCIFTIFALTGITNSINIIDGINGLASMVSMIIFLTLAYVGYKVGDYFIATICLSMIGALAGFFVLNYPNGLIFLGDNGAYLTGFYIGVISVILVKNHPEVSAWFPFLVCIYPIFETIFSIYRRKFIKGRSPGMPDCLHLHSLVYRRFTKWLLGKKAQPLKRNAVTSPFLWLICMIGVIPAISFWRNTFMLIFFSIIFVLIYLYFYRKMLLPRIPKWAKRQ
jgi:UDP-N-acetylmuramyl pentapeptide phosphotransferase/UDP-N-acetylglucosamine-1-phosphate transferase